MDTVISAIICSLIAIWLAVSSQLRFWKRRAESAGTHPRPIEVAVRGLIALCAMCAVLTCVLLLALAWSGIAGRGLKGAIEGSLATRLAMYAAAGAWGMDWLDARLRFRWVPRWRGPKLLPPPR